MTSCSRIIDSHHRVIFAVGVHIVTEETAGVYKSVEVEESADLGIVVAGLQVVESRVAVVVVTPIAKRVVVSQGVAVVICYADLAPGVVSVFRDHAEIFVYYLDYIALKVFDIIVYVFAAPVLVNNRVRASAFIVDEVQFMRAPLLYRELSSVIVIVERYAVYYLLCPKPVAVVGIVRVICRPALCISRKRAPVGPCNRKSFPLNSYWR